MSVEADDFFALTLERLQAALALMCATIRRTLACCSILTDHPPAIRAQNNRRLRGLL